VYRSPGHRFHGPLRYPPDTLTGTAKVTDLVHDPARTAPVAVVALPNGEEARLLAPAGIAVADSLSLHAGEPKPGSILALRDIPEGTRVYNLETRPGDGGKMVRSAGTSAVVITQGEKTVVQLPSGSYRDFDPRCRATIGVVGGHGRGDKPFAKAGKKFWAYRSKAKAYFKVRGIAMNPVNHPHGGGSHQHIGRPSSVGRGTWPGRKVGRLPPKKGKAKRRKEEGGA
jgi:large subunit ribosomal protein L2